MKKTVGKFLLECIRNLNVKDIFGVPGDYNLLFLDDIMEDKALRWVGNTNELNAGYAADAYARIHGISVLVTTGGVGELSAINAIGGAFAENVPIIHIIGHPSLQAEQDQRFIHHFLEAGERFTLPHREIAQKVSQMVGVVTRYNAHIEIPRLIQAAYEMKKPVTMYLPSDENNQFINANSFKPAYPASEKAHLHPLLKKIHTSFTKARSPILLVDLFASRFGLKNEVRKLVKKLNILNASTPFGRGALDETDPRYLGTYCGDKSTKEVKEAVENADTVLILGGLHECDYNTGYFTHQFGKAKNLIELRNNHAKINGQYVQGIWLKEVVEEMLKKFSAVSKKTYKKQLQKTKVPSSSQKLSQNSFWHEVAPLLSKEDAIGVFEVGTAIWASTSIDMAKNTEFVGSYGYASIGYATPAVLGTSMADPNRRTIAFIGDGSFQLTAQAVSTLLRHKLTPVIFLLNNDGYTIERVIHGPKEKYNDVQMWDYIAFAKSLTLNPNQIHSEKITTLKRLKEALKKIPKNKLVFFEVILGRMDAPQALKEMFEKPPKVNLYK